MAGAARATTPAPAAPAPAAELAADASPVAPAVAAGVAVVDLDPAAPWAAQVGAAPGGGGCARSWPPG